MLAALGLVVGSFLNVVIHRLPKMMEAQWAQDFADYRDEPAPDEVPLSLAYPWFAVPALQHQNQGVAEHSSRELCSPARSLCELRGPYFTTLSARGDGHSTDLGDLRFVFSASVRHWQERYY
jgi:hypothetical protein